MRPVLTRIVVLAARAPAAARGRPASSSCGGRSWRSIADRQEVTIKHDDIRGFMPGMTMPFKVRDARLLDGRTAGDLVTATLVVEKTDVFLSSGGAHGPCAGDRAAARRSRGWTLLAPGDRVPDVQLDGRDRRAPARCPSGAARRPGRHVHVHALSAAGLLSADGSTVCCRPARRSWPTRGFATGWASCRSASIPAFDTPEVLAGHAAPVGSGSARVGGS